MNKKKNVFLTNDIICRDWVSDDIDRYQYPKADLDPEDYEDSFMSFKDWVKDNICFYDNKDKEKILNLDNNELIKFYDGDEYPRFIETFERWCEENLSYDELCEMPMMNTLRYFPSFCTFDLEEANKLCSGATCLIYDNELNSYGVAMSGGGMNLSPHLIDTFINLGSGVPMDLAKTITRDWNAYVDEEKHAKNCKLIAKAMKEEAKRLNARAKQLLDK